MVSSDLLELLAIIYRWSKLSEDTAPEVRPRGAQCRLIPPLIDSNKGLGNTAVCVCMERTRHV